MRHIGPGELTVWGGVTYLYREVRKQSKNGRCSKEGGKLNRLITTEGQKEKSESAGGGCKKTLARAGAQ